MTEQGKLEKIALNHLQAIRFLAVLFGIFSSFVVIFKNANPLIIFFIFPMLILIIVVALNSKFNNELYTPRCTAWNNVVGASFGFIASYYTTLFIGRVISLEWGIIVAILFGLFVARMMFGELESI